MNWAERFSQLFLPFSRLLRKNHELKWTLCEESNSPHFIPLVTDFYLIINVAMKKKMFSVQQHFPNWHPRPGNFFCVLQSLVPIKKSSENRDTKIEKRKIKHHRESRGRKYTRKHPSLREEKAPGQRARATMIRKLRLFERIFFSVRCLRES